MEFRLQPLGFMGFLQNNNHQAINKIKWIENKKNTLYIFSIFNSFHFVNCLMIAVLQKLHETQGSQSKFHELNIYI